VSEVLDVCYELRAARRSKGSATALPREQRSIFVEWSRWNLERAVQAAMAEPRGRQASESLTSLNGPVERVPEGGIVSRSEIRNP
jgi:hypothetical protein